MKLLQQLAGYGFASACALGLDMALLWVLVHFFSVYYLWAATVSYLAGAAVGYFLAVTLAFHEHRLLDRRAEFLSFIALGAVGLGVNIGVMDVAVRLLGIQYLFAKCVAAGFSFSCNFILRRQLLFTRPAPQPDPSNVIDPRQ